MRYRSYRTRRRFRIFTRLTGIGRWKARHPQVTLDCLAPCNSEMLNKKRDLVSALGVTDKTLIVPKAIFAFED
jgi:hypothetical protein